MTPSLNWAELTVDQRLHGLRVAQHIAAEIARAGWVSFARFMELALYAPGLGYYSAGAHKFGESGDFITAPELSPLFGRTLARTVAAALERLGAGCVLEIGGGSGALAVSLLAELEQLGQLPTSYFILDLSADLRERQAVAIKAALPHLFDKVVWLESWPQVPIDGIVVANELLDAMPVERFVWRADGVFQVVVSLQNDTLVAVERKAPTELAEAVEQLRSSLNADWPSPYASEINFNLSMWFRGLAQAIRRGYVMLIDYGYHAGEYYAPERSQGTLMCHFRHRVHADPLFAPGLQDITSYVNFTAVADCAVAEGFGLMGYTQQANFLLAAGIDRLLSQFDPSDAKTYYEYARQFKSLVLPGEMGERFKVIGFTKDVEGDLPGFGGRDFSDRL